MLLTDEDFDYCKLDGYFQGSIVSRLQLKDVRVFHAYFDDWENMQFGSKGDKALVAKDSAKYGALKYLDADRDDIVGTFHEMDCVLLTKCKKLERLEQAHRKMAEVWGIPSQSWEYMTNTTWVWD